MKKFQKIINCFLILVLTSIPIFGIYAQNGDKLLLDSCIVYAMQNYPLVKQFLLIEQTTQYSLSNLSKGYYPQISINGQATYQSDVTQIQMNGTLPPQLNIDFPTMEKDQYKIYGEIVQPLTDFATIYNSKKIVDASADMEKQKIEVELHKIREKVMQIFLGIQLLEEPPFAQLTFSRSHSRVND